MRRSTTCKTCGRTIRATLEGMSLGAAVRKHYWRRHREVMMRRYAEQTWDADRDAGRRGARKGAKPDVKKPRGGRGATVAS